MKHTQKGFSLIELLTVIAIIGLLTAWAIPAYQQYTIKAAAGEALSVVGGIQDEVAAYWSTAVAMPTDLELGRTPTDTQSTNIASVAVGTGGEIEVVYGNNAPSDIAAQSLTFTPYTSADGTISWQCGDKVMPATLTPHGNALSVTNVSDAYLPSSCK